MANEPWQTLVRLPHSRLAGKIADNQEQPGKSPAGKLTKAANE